jgi:tetratricopeptide (TPR) repeat protein
VTLVHTNIIQFGTFLYNPTMSSLRITTFITCCIALVLAAAVLLPSQASGTILIEDMKLAMEPSAGLAYSYAIRHFDAIHPEEYDIVRAEQLLRKAYELDPAHPNLNHQLARIAFLKGHFDVALMYVNTELEVVPDPSPSSYYMRGLIRGFMGDFAGAAADYEAYLRIDPKNWAGINDYAWVLLKANRPLDALVALDWGLIDWPENPWLLNSKATAHFELGQLDAAHEAVVRAETAVAIVTEADWLKAYPGNDPLIAAEGLSQFRQAVSANKLTIEAARASNATE